MVLSYAATALPTFFCHSLQMDHHSSLSSCPIQTASVVSCPALHPRRRTRCQHTAASGQTARRHHTRAYLSEHHRGTPLARPGSCGILGFSMQGGCQRSPNGAMGTMIRNPVRSSSPRSSFSLQVHLTHGWQQAGWCMPVMAAATEHASSVSPSSHHPPADAHQGQRR